MEVRISICAVVTGGSLVDSILVLRIQNGTFPCLHASDVSCVENSWVLNHHLRTTAYE
jgi:hypothetical protein